MNICIRYIYILHDMQYITVQSTMKPNSQTIAIISTLWCMSRAQPRVCWSDGDFQSYARCCFSRPWSLSLRCRCCRCFWISDHFVKKWQIVFCGFVQKRWAPLKSNGSVYLTFFPLWIPRNWGKAVRGCESLHRHGGPSVWLPSKNMFGYFRLDIFIHLGLEMPLFLWTLVIFGHILILLSYALPGITKGDIFWNLMDNSG